MSDPFLERGEQIKKALLAMERDARDEDLFSLGYLIPQIELVLEMADYDPDQVEAEDFDATYEQWLGQAFNQDGMSDDDQAQTEGLWLQARESAVIT